MRKTCHPKIILDMRCNLDCILACPAAGSISHTDKGSFKAAISSVASNTFPYPASVFGGNTSNEIFTLFSDNLSLIFMSNLLRSLLLSIKCCINPHIVLQNFSMRNLSASPALQSYSSRVFYRNKSALHTAQYASSHAHYSCRN